MGSCTSVKKKDTEFLGDPQPQNVQAWNLPNLPLVETQIRISNVKLKHVPYTEASVLVSIPGLLDIKLEKKKGPQSIKWTFDRSARVKLTEYELRKKFLYINVFQVGAVEVKVAEIKLNLFLIATGPYHLDFPIRYTNKMEGRVSIDVRISEIVDVSIESSEASVHLLTDRPGEIFNYSIRSIINAFKDTESEASYCERFQTSYNKENKEEQANKRKSTKMAPQNVKLIWAQQKARANLTKLPSLKNKIIGSNVPNVCLQFLLWTVVKASSPDDTDAVQLVGECYVSYSKLLSKDFTVEERNGREYEVHLIKIEDKLWIHGKHTADIELSLKIVIPRFYKQMIVYLRTEEGIVKTSPVITLDAKAPECKELAELILSKDKIQEDLNALAVCMHDLSPSSAYKMRQLKSKIVTELSKQQLRLETSTKQSATMYNYRSQEEILKAQQVLLDIGFKLLLIVEDEDTGFRDPAFNCLVSLMKRGELSLIYIGFKAQEIQQIQNNDMTKYVTQKYEIAVKMQNFLYHILRNVLNFLNQKALQENERMFVELFCAYSYFRVPEFRHRLLSILTKPDDPPIVQWRGTEYSLNEQKPYCSTTEPHNNTFSVLFDWQSNFYDVIASDERSKHNLQELAEILDNQPWRHRMEKRGIGFFFFITYWVKYVEQYAIISEHVKWQNIPGYTQLLKALLCEMKKRAIMDYPDSLVDASIKILANEKLLNIFITILFKKTNMYDSNTVLKMIEILSKYFSELSKAKRHIPTNFYYNFFVAGIKTIIMSDHSYAIAKTLLLYYDHYNMLNITVRRDLNLFLLGKAFFKLFLNWSNNVRIIFHHLMVFRIHLQSNIVPKDKAIAAQQEYMINEEIKRRYSLLVNILENAKQKREQDDNLKFAYNFEKDYYKKMRKKLQDQRRGGSENPHIRKKIDEKEPKKYSLDELVKVPNVRLKSEAVPGVRVDYSKPTSQSDLSMILSYLHGKAYEPDQNQSSQQASKKIMFKRLTSHEADFEVAEIDIRSLQYLYKALAEFRDVEENFTKFFVKNTEKDPVPQVTVKVPIDEVELRPFQIDEW